MEEKKNDPLVDDLVEHAKEEGPETNTGGGDPSNEILEDIVTSPQPKGAMTTSASVDEGIDEEKDSEDILSLVFNDKTKSEKYKADLMDKAKTDPASIMIETPLGWMSVLEAAQMGFNPETGEFDESEGITTEAELDTSGLDPQTAEKLQADMDPQNQGFDEGYVEDHGGGPGMMEMLGMGGEGAPMPEGDPMMEEDMMGEGMPPEGMPMPPEEDPEGGLF